MATPERLFWPLMPRPACGFRKPISGCRDSQWYSQVLPAREQGNFDYIAVKLTVSGDLPALDEALAGIGAYLPLVLVESIDVYPARAARGKDEAPGQQVKANLQLLSLRAIQ